MEKNIQIITLPTEKVSQIHKHYELSTGCESLGWFSKLELTTKDTKIGDHGRFVNEPQHIYLLSNEDVKEGDCCMSFPEQLNPNNIHICIDIDCKLHNCKKIIASTDMSLGLPKPSNKFLKKFCELGGVPTCAVKYDYIHTDFAPNGFETFLKITSDNTVVTNLD